MSLCLAGWYCPATWRTFLVYEQLICVPQSLRPWIRQEYLLRGQCAFFGAAQHAKIWIYNILDIEGYLFFTFYEINQGCMERGIDSCYKSEINYWRKLTCCTDKSLFIFRGMRENRNSTWQLLASLTSIDPEAFVILSMCTVQSKSSSVLQKLRY